MFRGLGFEGLILGFRPEPPGRCQPQRHNSVLVRGSDLPQKKQILCFRQVSLGMLRFARLGGSLFRPAADGVVGFRIRLSVYRV